MSAMITVKPTDYDLTFNTPITFDDFLVDGVLHKTITRWPHYHSGYIVIDKPLSIGDVVNIEITHNNKTETVKGMKVSKVEAQISRDWALFTCEVDNQESVGGLPITTPYKIN